MWYLICVMVGVCIGIFLVSLMHVASYRVQQPEKCDHIRPCTCWQVRQQFDDESA